MNNSGNRKTGKARGPGMATRARRATFLAVLAETCNVRRAIAAAGISTTWTYEARAKDPEFAAQWDEALQQGYQNIEGELMRRALGDGQSRAVEEPEEPLPFDPTLALRLLDQRRRADPQGRRVPTRLKQPDAQTVLASLDRKLSAIEKQLARKR